MKKFTIGAAGRKNMRLGADEYWVEVKDGERSRPAKYDITAHDIAVDRANGKKARGVTWSAKKRSK